MIYHAVNGGKRTRKRERNRRGRKNSDGSQNALKTVHAKKLVK